MTSYQELPDATLLNLLKDGNYKAFTAIYDRHSLKTINHAQKIFHDREEAEDIVHDVFAGLWENRETKQINSTLPGYLHVAVRNRFLNNLRHEKVRNENMDSLLQFANSGAHFRADARIREQQLMEAIEKEILSMPQNMREVFELQRANPLLGYKDIAKLKGISDQAANTYLVRAKKKLRDRFGPFICFLWI